MRVLIVDDEDPARALLREFLEGREDVEIVGECRNGFEAVKAVAELRPDLVLLDIQMPKLDGFEVLELIGPDVNVNVVFVTAFDQHALKAFEVHAVDYLLKPVSQERLELALTRARARLAARDPLPVASLVNAARTARIERMVVRVGANVQVIPLAELDFIEAQDDYVGLRYRGKTYLKQQTLNEAEAALDPQRFVRIHRSYLLNIERMARLESEAKDQRVAVMREGARLPISRSGYARLKKLL
ncbi:MAG: response regulator [Vicinamibacteria bacterium]|nr:response regulator [Vicinamibacteria bacterium]